MAAWVVRGGQRGEHERRNLNGGCTTVRWAEAGDLSGCRSRDEVTDLVLRAYAGEPRGRHVSSTSQLWGFRGSLEVGDLIVMPSKPKKGILHVGRVAGEYSYAPEEPDENRRHVSSVDWFATTVNRAELNQDLQDALKGRKTVFALKPVGAEERLEAAAGAS